MVEKRMEPVKKPVVPAVPTVKLPEIKVKAGAKGEVPADSLIETRQFIDTQTGAKYWENEYVSGGLTISYNPSDSAAKITASTTPSSYKVEFSGNDGYGMPVTTDSTGLPSGRTDNHRVPIKFLGEDWLISKLGPFTKQVRLSQEAAYGVLNVGDILESGDIKVRLVDISVATEQDSLHPAIVDVMDKNDNVVYSGQKINPGDVWVANVGGTDYPIRCYETHPGFTLAAKWASIGTYASDLNLIEGDVFNVYNPGWYVHADFPIEGGEMRIKGITVYAPNTIGIDEGKVVPGKMGVTVTPTIAKGSVSFEYKGPIDSNAKLEIYDAAGRKVKTAEFGGSQKIAVNVSDMASGVYFATFTVEGKENRAKFTVIK